MSLKPTPPCDAKNRYLRRKEGHVSNKTKYNYDCSLKRFIEWCDEAGIENLNQLDSELLDRFTEWRLNDVKPITARNDVRTVKNFIEYCETIQAVPVGLHELVKPPKVREDDEISDDILTREEATAILDYLGKYEYASLRHVILLLLWKCGMRIGGLRALDVEDYDRGRPALEIRHRPETGTPLKRHSNSERDVIISEKVVEVLNDYLENTRPEVVDNNDRRPLVATNKGRIAETTIQRHVYCATRPCYYNGGECPFDLDPETCDANTWNGAHACEGSVSPHALRRGYVTAARNAGQPKEVTGERVNMSGKILDKHYDKGSHDEKAERRREFLKDI